ncbi:hypothetical protein HD806DRAFT_552739 [Xylariaceae sp. AK1471]|nr:hypothetical protein HD806DRAFT_552739 [Xylariaceae sp. AK1471]
MEPDWAHLAVTPAAMAPPGMTSNFINPESRAWNVELTIGITLIPAIILVALRIYARLGLARSLGVDDYVCIIATIFTIAFNGLVLSFLDKPGGGPIGRHMWDVPLLRFYKYSGPSIIETIFLRISNTLVKVSLLAFYLRIFNPVPRLKFMIWVGLVAVVGFCIAVIIGTLVLCIPRPGDLDTFRLITVPQRCFFNIPKVTTAGTVFSVISDFYILFIPIHILPSLKLSRKRKAAVGSVFLLGFLTKLTSPSLGYSACLAGLANLAIRFDRYLPTKLHDFTWNAVDTYITKTAETNIGLLCSCMPVVSAVVTGPMRRLSAFVNAWFQGSKTDVLPSRGYRDPPPTAGTSPQGADTLRNTIISLRTLMWKTSGSRDRHEESSILSILPTHHDSRASQPSSAHGSHRSDTTQSSKDERPAV